MNKTEMISFIGGNNGVLPIIPTFIPRRFGTAGRRLKLHPHDYFALGTERGSIKERWFSSIIAAMNGPLAPADEGISYVQITDTVEGKVALKDFVEALGAELLGDKMMKNHGTWPMYSKFFDYEGPLFHHLHLDFESAARVGRIGKPEAYYYPAQLNNYAGTSPYTYFGFSPEVTKEEVKGRLENYTKEDTRITELSRAYRIELGTGWYTAPGVVHAPGSYLTYEPQWNSDVNSVYENVVQNEIYPYDMLVENCPEDKKNDMDYVISLMDWEKNVDPNYRENFYRPPLFSSEDDNHVEKWISYGNEYISAKELTVFPGKEVVIKDETPYGCIFVQGFGTINGNRVETPQMLRFGQTSADEFFVSYDAASKGVVFKNTSSHENLVVLKHFPSDENTPVVKQK